MERKVVFACVAIALIAIFGAGAIVMSNTPIGIERGLAYGTSGGYEASLCDPSLPLCGDNPGP